jgi:RNA polymerase sigma-70 factor (ECF subfamily)
MLDERYLSQLPADRSRLVRVAQRLLGTPAEAEDAVQESYLRALETGAGGSAAAHEAKAWLTTVMQNLAIDRIRRRDWMGRWLHDAEARALTPPSPSAEDQAALAEEADHALHLMATTLSAADGAALLLREVFAASYGEIAEASGKTEAGCRQQVHRALVRLRQHAPGGPAARRAADGAQAEATFHVYLQSLRNVDMQPLLGLLGQPATRALANSTAGLAESTPRARCEVVQVGGRLGLVLTLGGRFVCVLPLGVRSEIDAGHPEARAAACG